MRAGMPRYFRTLTSPGAFLEASPCRARAPPRHPLPEGRRERDSPLPGAPSSFMAVLPGLVEYRCHASLVAFPSPVVMLTFPNYQ